MIELIDFIPDAQSGRLFIAWDKDGIAQPVFQPSMQELLDLLMEAGYLEEYNLYNGGEAADVFFIVDGQKHHCSFSYWLSQEVDTQLCLNLLNYYVHV